MTAPGRVRLALVHHLNQHIITDGYTDRQGISAIAEGYAAALRLHARHGIPATLHLSGTLIEALAWHCPRVLEDVRAMRADGLIALIGSAYAQNIMPLFPADFNRRQLVEHLSLYDRHLGCSPTDVQVCWIPERVWNTETLAPVLTDPQLPNGGYRFVLLDDRLLYRTNSAYEASARAAFDGSGPATAADALARRGSRTVPRGAQPQVVCRIAEGRGLQLIPMSALLRYYVPPSHPAAWEGLGRLIDGARSQGGAVLTYADDLERTAGVGGWDLRAMRSYDTFLRWLARNDDVAPVLLPDPLIGQVAAEERVIEPGTFFELAQQWGAGEDYHGWSGSPRWAPSRRQFASGVRAVQRMVASGADESLTDLAQKHLLASAYETAWHDAVGDGRVPAAWAVAVASHSRACLPMERAAAWFREPNRRPHAESTDVDEDGERELVLANRNLFAVLAPAHGARLVYLFQRTVRGVAMVVGNPSDDWNLQSELNQYMDRPPNHPGALADVGFEHDSYEVIGLAVTPSAACVTMVNTTGSSPLRGATKSVLVSAGATSLAVRYQLSPQVPTLRVDACLSPDYLSLLRDGRAGVQGRAGSYFRGARNGATSVWVATVPGEQTEWAPADRPEAGHGFIVRVQGQSPRFHLAVGAGDAEVEGARLPRYAHLMDRLLPRPAVIVRPDLAATTPGRRLGSGVPSG